MATITFEDLILESKQRLAELSARLEEVNRQIYLMQTANKISRIALNQGAEE